MMDLQLYRANIDRVIQERTGELVLNGSHEHATIIIERMFAHAKTSVQILSRDFDARVFGTSRLMSTVRTFLGSPERHAKVIVEEFDNKMWDQHPLLKEFGDNPQFTLAILPKKLADKVTVNFAIMDNDGYRFEEDKQYPVAVASFGDRQFFTDELLKLFNSLWDVSEVRPHQIESV